LHAILESLEELVVLAKRSNDHHASYRVARKADMLWNNALASHR
jgi:hypothetical protein